MHGWRRHYRRGRDRGASVVEYGAVLLLVSAIVAAVTVVAIPDTVASKTKAAVCSVFSGKDCDPGENGDAGGPPSPGSSSPAQTPTTAPASSGPVSAEQADYDKAKKNAETAEQEAKNGETEFSGLEKELLDFLIDLIGITDAKNCLTKGDLVACISTAADFVPWGKAFKLLKKLPGAFKLAKKFKNIWDKVAAARKKRDEANKALKSAEDKLNKKKADDAKKNPDAACSVPNSFVPGTPVLLADGSRKPIERVKVGDEVLATDPDSGTTQAKKVVATIHGDGEKHLVEVNVDTGDERKVGTGPLIATDGHPIWVAGNLKKWVDAADLKPGMWLRTSAGTHVQVTAIKTWTQHQRVHNLTIADLHTYYVTVGGQDILVHNDDPCSKAKTAWAKKADFSDNKTLSKKYDAHAADFDVTGNRNKAKIEEFKKVMNEHMTAPGTKIYRFNYRNQGNAIGFIDPSTGKMVMLDSNGKFWTAYKLGDNQFKDIVDKGFLW